MRHHKQSVDISRDDVINPSITYFAPDGQTALDDDSDAVDLIEQLVSLRFDDAGISAVLAAFLCVSELVVTTTFKRNGRNMNVFVFVQVPAL